MRAQQVLLVVDRLNGQALEGAVVFARSGDGTEFQQRTNAGGSVLMEPKFLVDVRCYMPGYRDEKQSFNASPDESEYYRELILKENVSNSLVMI